MLIKMTILRKTVRVFFNNIYNYLICKTNVFPVEKECVSYREYLIQQSDDTSSINE
jgi:hypothetical protein